MHSVLFFLLSVFVVLCCALQHTSDDSLFREFVQKYQKSYPSSEYSRRAEIFANNLKYIREYNSKHGNILGVNKFADMTNDEFRATTHRLPQHRDVMKTTTTTTTTEFHLYDSAIPNSFDWRNQSVVGPVVNQGECASTEIFAIVESISSIYAIEQHHDYQALDVNQLIQCLDTGCSGAGSSEVFDYIGQHGLAFKFSGGCPKGQVADGVCTEGYACVARGNETALAVALLNQGPLYVLVDGSMPSFQLYDGGVYEPPNCNKSNLDTALLLTGYTQSAWICQNSWGTFWGMNGIILIARNKGNMCGIATEGCFPIGVQAC